ncbi:MAG: 2Fe-2S iron-sulfur cluster binding domain-containing protein [Chloroflexi bacterium]|nr:2Fe-2S iron-sulfur cluster binding domain-containing protein [Chloroflexota bacterium]MBM4451168.1 2Fe-2S iron-sulfur cluster binding domain-containing protein [Chloroflexota bacterium]MBM4453119.1 2Fe-2S iron-sulfur cluster binding domain-containing protein [Chloroflexota bacterium]
MAEKKEIKLTINSREARGKEGDTILDICRANDIYVPTLCHLEGLSVVGACRLCVVEIEGERRINPACTYPARDGLVVRTDTEQLEKYRRLMLELIFTERNHFCFFCAASGDCELQKLAYQYQMDHARYQYTFPTLPTDTLNDFLVVDHNRCILCGRCVRVCAEVVSSHTLSFANRGWRTMVVADLNQPLGESSCISCGACVQACPTGAIFSKTSAYRGRTNEGKIIRSLCSLCGMSCDIDVLIKDNNIVRIDGANLTRPKGQLCRKGRFEQVYREAPRIATPLVAAEGQTIKASSWEEAFELARRGIEAYRRRYGANSIAGFASSLCPTETLEAFAKLMRDTIGTSLVDTLDGSAYRTLTQGMSKFSKNGQGLETESPLESILKSDCIIVVGCNPLQSHPVAGCYMLQAQIHDRAQLVVIDWQQNSLGARADLWLRPNENGMGDLISALASMLNRRGKRSKQTQGAVSLASAALASGLDETLLEQAANMLAAAKKGVVVYGNGLWGKKDAACVRGVLELASLVHSNGPKAIALKPWGNSRGAWELGIASKDEVTDAKPKLVYLLLADQEFGGEDFVFRVAEQAEFLIVQASYTSPLTEVADVVLPSPIWAEREGTYISVDGKAGRSKRILEPLPGIKDDLEIFAQMTQRLQKRRPMLWKR